MNISPFGFPLGSANAVPAIGATVEAGFAALLGTSLTPAAGSLPVAARGAQSAVLPLANTNGASPPLLAGVRAPILAMTIPDAVSVTMPESVAAPMPGESGLLPPATMPAVVTAPAPAPALLAPADTAEAPLAPPASPATAPDRATDSVVAEADVPASEAVPAPAVPIATRPAPKPAPEPTAEDETPADSVLTEPLGDIVKPRTQRATSTPVDAASGATEPTPEETIPAAPVAAPVPTTAHPIATPSPAPQATANSDSLREDVPLPEGVVEDALATNAPSPQLFAPQPAPAAISPAPQRKPAGSSNATATVAKIESVASGGAAMPETLADNGVLPTPTGLENNPGDSGADTARSDDTPAPLQSASQPAQSFASRVTAAPAPAAPVATPEVEMAARAGQLGQAMGVEIARRIDAGEETLRVRLNPVELGRVDVTLAFDSGGSLKATVSTESPRALELLRQDLPDLARTLDQAGVRTDAQSFRFESRTGSDGQPGHPGQQRGHDPRGQHSAKDEFETAPAYRAIRSDSRVDLLA